MRIGMVGLGRMGLNMTRRLLLGGHEVVAYDISPKGVKEAAGYGAEGAGSLGEMVGKLKPPRFVWLMVPAGKPVDDAVEELSGLLGKGDTVIDGGNSHFKDAGRRMSRLSGAGASYLDVGTSGGIWGLEEGYCLMIGGDEKAYRKLLPVLKTLAPKDGYLYCGPTGAGHFVKMVHNGIEYGMMSAYGEGFEILDSSPYAGSLDYKKVAHLWNQGSVIRSWLLELAEDAFSRDPKLASLEPYVDDSGEGRWTLMQAIESATPAPVIASALFQRFASRGHGSFSNRLLAALRQQFGGHAVKRKKAR